MGSDFHLSVNFRTCAPNFSAVETFVAPDRIVCTINKKSPSHSQYIVSAQG